MIADPSSLEGFLGWVVLLAAALTASAVLLKYARIGGRRLWRFVGLSIRAFEIIERELAPNGGGSTYDIVRTDHDRLAAVEAKVVALHEQGQVLTGYAERNRGLAAAAQAAAELAAEQAAVGRAVAERVEQQRRGDVTDLRGAMSTMREDLAMDAAQRTADAYELLAEHGGPDLRAHAPDQVADHTHSLPQRREPTLTSGPVLTEEQT